VVELGSTGSIQKKDSVKKLALTAKAGRIIVNINPRQPAVHREFLEENVYLPPGRLAIHSVALQNSTCNAP
jgi:hypothetical protein